MVLLQGSGACFGGSRKVVGADGGEGRPQWGRGVLRKNWDKVTNSGEGTRRIPSIPQIPEDLALREGTGREAMPVSTEFRMGYWAGCVGIREKEGRPGVCRSRAL